MSKKSKTPTPLPFNISSKGVTQAIENSSLHPVALQLPLIGFTLRYTSMAEFNQFFAQDKFTTDQMAPVLFTEAARIKKIQGSFSNDPYTGAPIAPFRAEEFPIKPPDGLVVLTDPSLLSDMHVYDRHSDTPLFPFKPESSAQIYLAQPAYLPQTIIRNSHGQAYLCQHPLETVQDLIDDALLNHVINHGIGANDNREKPQGSAP